MPLKAKSPTYIASLAMTFAAYATPEDFLTLENPVGSGKLLHLANFRLFPASTAAALMQIFFIRRSTLNSGGTSTTQAGAKADSADDAASGVLRLYTAAPTPGTAESTLSISRGNTTVLTGAGGTLQFLASSANIANDLTFVKPVIIRPGQCLSANLASQALPAGFVTGFEITWSEQGLNA